jgi:hypothetical protein
MAGLLALVAAAVFFGAAVYINLAEHPARLRLEDHAALAEWRTAYPRGYAMQASLVVLSGVLGMIAWWTSREALWLAGALVILANWPFTLLVILPTNKLLEATPATGDGQTRERLRRWGRLHAVRSLLGAAATIIYAAAIARGR